MIHKLSALFLAALICLLSACSNGAIVPSGEASSLSEAGYRKITAQAAKTMMEETTDYILLDVRTAEEFFDSHIEGAILIPDYEIRSRAESELTDQNAAIFVYCRTGRRSEIAAKELLELGYANVFDFGGIIDWPYATVNE